MADLVRLLSYQPDFDWDHLHGFLAHGELQIHRVGLTGPLVHSVADELA